MKMYARFKDVDKGDRSFFTFSKTVVFPGPIHQRRTDEKYEALKNESFEYIHIPDFTYSIDDNKITYDIEFIKGTQLNPISFMLWRKKIYKDFTNGSEWGFHEQQPENFVVEDNTEKLYLVDFESFEKMTLNEKRESYMQAEKQVMKDLDKIKKDLKTIHMNDFWK